MAQQRQITNVDTDVAGIVRITEPLLDAIVPAKQPVRAATTAALPANTRTGNILTASANGVIPAQDGVTLVVGDRFLVQNEAAGANNGFYTVTDLGSGGTPWILTRSIDADSSAKVISSVNVIVEEGTIHAASKRVLTTFNPITLNTTALVFGALAISAADITAGTLAIVRGGTSGATKTAAFDALSPVTTKGDIIVRNGSNNIRLAVGADDEVLTADAAEASGIKWAVAGGGSPTFDDIYNNSGADPTVTVDNGEIRFTDGGSLPAFQANTVMVWGNTSASGDTTRITILAGTSGQQFIGFGDSGDDDQSVIQHFMITNLFRFLPGGDNFLQLGNGLFTVNEDGGDVDTRIEGDTLTHMLFCEGNAASENIAFLTTAAPNWQSMDRGYFLGDVTTAPSGNPTAGVFVYVTAGAAQVRGGGGTVTEWGPSGLHCETCGSDFWTVASMNMNWKSWCFICGVCGTAYRGGPQNVLDQLTPKQNTELIRQTSTWEDVKNLMKLVA